MNMTYVIIFCIFLTAAFIGCIIADARNVRAEFDKMWTAHYEAVRRITAEDHEKARELYLRHPIL